MSFRSYRRRFRELSWGHRLLLAETAARLAAASLAIRLLPFRRIVGAIAAPASKEEAEPQAAEAMIESTRWAIEASARVLPWKIVCFQKGLTMQWMLRRRNIASRLHYGVAQDEQSGVKAHVWITYHGEPIIGGDEAVGYACLAVFPPDDARKQGDAASIVSRTA